MDKRYKYVALTIKKMRQERGWSLDKTAKATGVSKTMLSQIEREQSSPTIATLWKIADGFNISFSAFINEETASINSNDVHCLDPTVSLGSPNEKIRVTPLFPFDAQLNCEIFMLELLPGYEHLSSPHQCGVIEHVIVGSGTMELLLNGIWHTLTSGSGIRFKADQDHGYRNHASEKTLFYSIVHYANLTQSKI